MVPRGSQEASKRRSKSDFNLKNWKFWGQKAVLETTLKKRAKKQRKPTPKTVNLVKQWNGKHIVKNKSVELKLTANRKESAHVFENYLWKTTKNLSRCSSTSTKRPHENVGWLCSLRSVRQQSRSATAAIVDSSRFAHSVTRFTIAILGSCWPVLPISWLMFDFSGSWRHLGRFWGHLAHTSSLVWLILAILGLSRKLLWFILCPSWLILGVSWHILGASWNRNRNNLILEKKNKQKTKPNVFICFSCS